MATKITKQKKGQSPRRVDSARAGAQSARFGVDAGILTILGEQLVSDASRALSELVKNSYDADASHCVVSFDDSQNTRAIVISDDGHGMTIETLRRSWLHVATRSKRTRSTSPNGRPMSGSMGIGRLAAFSLATEVVLETGTSSAAWHRLTLDMRRFEQAKSLSDVAVRIEKIAPPALRAGVTSAHGTKITLKRLRSWWPSESELLDLSLRFSALMGPSAKDFLIGILGHGKHFSCDPVDRMLASPLTVSATVDEAGVATVAISASASLYRGAIKLPPNGWRFPPSPAVYTELSGVRLEVAWRPRGARGVVEYWDVASIRAKSDEDVGIRLYRDDVRVMPYGEPEDDWLKLEEDYVAGGARERRPRRNQMSGWILVSRARNSSLEDTANREGLIKNAAFQQLLGLARAAMRRLAEVRRELEPNAPPASSDPVHEVQRAIEAAKSVRSHLPEGDSAKNMDVVLDALRSVQASVDLLALYRDRLTAGNLLRLVLHDAGAALRSAQPLLEVASAQPCEVSSHSPALELLLDISRKVLGGYDLLRGAGRTGAYRTARVNVSNVAGTLVERFRASTSLQTTFTVDIASVFAQLRESDVWSILINLMHNAVTSGEFAQRTGRAAPQHRQVHVVLQTEGDTLVIECEDNGPGLPDESPEWIWSQFNSTREGGGSGLGLWIVAEAVRAYGGKYEATPSSRYSPGARFSIRLPGVIS